MRNIRKDNMLYYMTFGQASPFKDGWVTIDALDEDIARKWARNYPHWCGLYTEVPALADFQDGEIGRITL